MLRSKRVLALLLGSIAMGSLGCSLSIDQIFAMKEGSAVDVFVLGTYGGEQKVDTLVFDGGTVMRINVSTTLLDYLDGTVDGDVEIVDLLFSIPNFHFILFDVGLICVVLDDPPGGGTFNYNVLGQEAAFDVLVNTNAVLTTFFANLIRGGAFKFPFDLEATVPMTLVDALGLFTGTGSLAVTQPIDAYYSVPIINKPDDPSQDYDYPIHVKGEVTVETTDTFPATPGVLSCLDYFGA